MKKIFTLSLVIMMTLIMAVSSFAAGAFIASPTGVAAPKLVAATNNNIDCVAELIIESYSDRKNFDDAAYAEMNAAYKTIKETDDLGKLNKELAALAEKYKVTSDKLAVSDLFEIHHKGCEDHANCGSFTITIKPNTVENFIAIMHFENGEWKLLESTVGEDGTVTFVADDFSPFAIVAHDGTGKAPMSAGAVAGITVGSVAAVAAVGGVVAYVLIKKKKA